MLDFFQFTIGSFASLFPVADPLGAVPLFIVLSANAPPELRKEFTSKIGGSSPSCVGKCIMFIQKQEVQYVDKLG